MRDVIENNRRGMAVTIVFSIGGVGYVIMFLVGTQCLSELFYAYYYTKMVKTKKTDKALGEE